MMLGYIVIAIIILYIIVLALFDVRIDTKSYDYIFIWYYWYYLEDNRIIKRRVYSKIRKIKK